MNITAATGTPPEALRASMVDHVMEAGHACSGPVEEAMRTIPRHRFVPVAPVEDAYADLAVITKRASDGAALSCVSVPAIVAMMLDQLDANPGDRILEIGAGTGYNAALLAHLTGPSGQVTTVDIDPEVTAQARQALGATGYSPGLHREVGRSLLRRRAPDTRLYRRGPRRPEWSARHGSGSPDPVGRRSQHPPAPGDRLSFRRPERRKEPRPRQRCRVRVVRTGS